MPAEPLGVGPIGREHGVAVHSGLAMGPADHVTFTDRQAVATRVATASSAVAGHSSTGAPASFSDGLRAGTPTAVERVLEPTRGLGATFRGSAAQAVDTSLLPRLAGRALLDQLALLPAADIAAFVTEHPETVSRLLLNPPSAASVASWWALTSSDSRRALTTAAPELIGNLDGLDTSLRDSANRTFLRESIAQAEHELPSLGRAERADAEQRLHMLNEIEDSLVTTAIQPRRSLLSVDVAWPGRASVVVGDLEAADFVSFMVPGMFFTVDNQMVDWTVISQDLYDEQELWLGKLVADDPAFRDASIAVVSWIGYETPGLLDVMSLDLAQDGAKYISSSVQGLQQTRSDREPHITLMTHSYGSTATMTALARGSMQVDSLVVIGSPGSAARSVADLGMRPDQVYVGKAAMDPVVNSAFFGSDPGSDSFGATTMSVAGVDDPLSKRALAPASGHLGYFDAGSAAMRNMALVGLGRGDLVADDDRPRPGTQFAAGG